MPSPYKEEIDAKEEGAGKDSGIDPFVLNLTFCSGTERARKTHTSKATNPGRCIRELNHLTKILQGFNNKTMQTVAY